jgi:hypothetical protein
VTIASGRSRYVKARKVRNKRLGDACHWWAFALWWCLAHNQLWDDNAA